MFVRIFSYGIVYGHIYYEWITNIYQKYMRKQQGFVSQKALSCFSLSLSFFLHVLSSYLIFGRKPKNKRVLACWKWNLLKWRSKIAFRVCLTHSKVVDMFAYILLAQAINLFIHFKGVQCTSLLKFITSILIRYFK